MDQFAASGGPPTPVHARAMMPLPAASEHRGSRSSPHTPLLGPRRHSAAPTTAGATPTRAPSPSRSRLHTPSPLQAGPKMRPVSRAQQLRTLQAELDPADPLRQALSYALAHKPLQTTIHNVAPLAIHTKGRSHSRSPSRSPTHSPTDEQKDASLLFPPLSPSPAPSGRRPAAVADRVDRYSNAVVLRPHVDTASFLARNSHLNPNARFDPPTEHSVGRRRPSAGGFLPGEDEEDTFWRELFITQSKPGTTTHTRQLNHAIPTHGILLDREQGTPVTTHVARTTDEDTRTHEERVMGLVNQLRSKPAAGGGAARSRKSDPPVEDDDDSEIYTYSSNRTLVAAYTPITNSGPRTLIDENGFARNTPQDADGLPIDGQPSGPTSERPEPTVLSKSGSRHKLPRRQSPSRRVAFGLSSESVAPPPPSLAEADQDLLDTLARLEYEYAFEGDTAKFFKPKSSAKIHPAWLRGREDFKAYFGARDRKSPTKTPSGQKRAAPEEKQHTLHTSSSAKALPSNLALRAKSTGSVSATHTAALSAARSAHASSAALDALAAPSSSPLPSSPAGSISGAPAHVSSEIAQAVSHPSPTNALDLLALHAAEKPPSQRSAADKANIALLLSGIEYFARLPASVRTGLAELVQLQRASRDEVLFTRIHGTRFMYVVTGNVVSSSSISGQEFADAASSTEQIKKRITAEREKKMRAVERRKKREADQRRRADRRARGLPESEEDEPTPAQLVEAATKEKAATEAAAAAAAAKAAATAKANSRILGPSRAAMRERAEMGGGRPAGWSTAQKEIDEAAAAALKQTSISSTTVAVPSAAAPTQKRTSAVSFATPPEVASAVPTRRQSVVSTPASSQPSRPTAQQQQQAAARAMLASLDPPGAPSREVRGFQIGLAQPSVWSPNVQRITAASTAAAEAAALLSPVPASTTVDHSLRLHLPTSAGASSPAADSGSVLRHGMVFQRVLPASSLFGQNEMFEGTYAGLDGVMKLRRYQQRLGLVVRSSGLSSGWAKLRMVVHVMLTSRDKAPIDSVIASSPCVLLTWGHKELEQLIIATKERGLHSIISNLNHFRDLLFPNFGYKMLLHLATAIELREFGPGTILYNQGQIDKPVWDEATHTLRSSQQVFDEACARAQATEHAAAMRRNPELAASSGALLATASSSASSAINNFNHNPANHSLMLLTGGMLQLEKSCTMQRAQRWPASRTTWELTSHLVTKKFFGGFIRGKEIIGGEAFLGMSERDFTVSVPAGQTATCIVIRRGMFDLLSQKRIQHAVWTSVVRLRELAATTISSRIELRNTTINNGAAQALKEAKQTPTHKLVGKQSVNEYIAHVTRKDTGVVSTPTPATVVGSPVASEELEDTVNESDLAVPEFRLSNSRGASAGPKPSTPGPANAPPTAAQVLLAKIVSSATQEETGEKVSLDDLMRQAHENEQKVKEDRSRLELQRLKATSEQILSDVAKATAAFDQAPAEEETESYLYMVDGRLEHGFKPAEPVVAEAPPAPSQAHAHLPEAAFVTPKKVSAVATVLSPITSAPNSHGRQGSLSSSALGSSVAKSHHRSISNAINNLPFRKGETTASASAATPTAAPLVGTTTPSPAKPRLATSQSVASLPSHGPSPSLSHARSATNLLPAVLSPIAASLPSLLSAVTPSVSSSSGQAAANVHINHAYRSFSRSDARARDAAFQKDEATAARLQVRLKAAADEQSRVSNQKRAFFVDIESKLNAYDLRQKAHQTHKEVVYAAKIVEINRRLQASITRSHYDNPFAISANGTAIEASRHSAKLKQLLLDKAEKAAEAYAAKVEAAAARGERIPVERIDKLRHTTAHLTPAELESLGISLPPPPLPIEDLSQVSKALWEKNIRYLTDLEAEQRLVYAEYMASKSRLAAEAAEHDTIRVGLLNKRYLKGVLVHDAQAATEDARKDQAMKREKADEEWRLKKEFDTLNESMLAMGVAGDEDAEAALLNQVEVMTDPSSLNQNLRENADFMAALIRSRAVPRSMSKDAANILVASTVAAEEQVRAQSYDPAVQMGLAVTDEPPITDVMEIRGPARRTETHSDIMSDSRDVLHGAVVGLYFPPLPPPPDLRTRITNTASQSVSQQITPRDYDLSDDDN